MQAAAPGTKAVVIGGGLLGLEAARGLLQFGCEVHVVHLSAHLMEQQLDGPAGRILKTTMEGWASGCTCRRPRGRAGRGTGDRLAFRDGSTLDCDMVVVAAGIRPNTEIGLRCGLTVERGIVVDDQCARSTTATSMSSASARSTAARSTGWWRRSGSRPRCWPTTSRGRTGGRLSGSKLATKLKVMGVEVASMGVTEPADEDDEVVQFTEPKHGTYKKLIMRNGRLVGGILLGDISKAPI